MPARSSTGQHELDAPRADKRLLPFAGPNLAQADHLPRNTERSWASARIGGPVLARPMTEDPVWSIPGPAGLTSTSPSNPLPRLSLSQDPPGGVWIRSPIRRQPGRRPEGDLLIGAETVRASGPGDRAPAADHADTGRPHSRNHHRTGTRPRLQAAHASPAEINDLVRRRDRQLITARSGAALAVRTPPGA